MRILIDILKNIYFILDKQLQKIIKITRKNTAVKYLI